MHINFLDITNEKLKDEACQLQVASGQANFIETVEACLQEANEIPCWHPIIIQIDAISVGFAMYGLWINEGNDSNANSDNSNANANANGNANAKKGRVWFDRFLIDKKFQGKGYSKIILPMLLQKIKNEFNYPKLYLSVYDTNPIAIKLYKSFGFQFNGELDSNGEKIMVLNT